LNTDSDYVDPYGKPKNETIAHLRYMCRTNLKFLCKEMLGMDKWDDVLHDHLQNFLETSGNNKLILIPRDHFKSSFVTVGWTIQQLLIDPNLTFLIRNGVWDLARDFLKQISGYLKSEMLTMVFGEFCLPNSTWTKEVIEIAQKTDLVERQPTITTAGLETALTGKHFKIVIDDDLVGEHNVTSKEQIQKVIQLSGDTENLLSPGGRHIYIGTRWANRDLYGDVLINNTITVNKQYINAAEGAEGWRNAYNRFVRKEPNIAAALARGKYEAYVRRAEENGRPIFASRFCLTDKEQKVFAALGQDKKSLETLKRNPARYACQMNNDPLDDDMIEFRREWMIRQERTPELMAKLGNTAPLISIDPAFRQKQTNDFSGICVTKSSAEGAVYVFEAKQVKMNPADLVNEIFRLVSVYRPHQVLIETVSAQILLVDLLKNEMRKRKQFFTITEVKSNTTETKAMKIRGLTQYYSNGCIFHLGPLVDLESQLLEFPRGTHDDIIDSLSMQIPYWKFQAQPKATPAQKEYTWDWWQKRTNKPKNGIQKLFQDLKGM